MSRNWISLMFFVLVVMGLCTASDDSNLTTAITVNVSTSENVNVTNVEFGDNLTTTADSDTSVPRPSTDNISISNSSHEPLQENTQGAKNTTEPNVTESTTNGTNTSGPTTSGPNIPGPNIPASTTISMTIMESTAGGPSGGGSTDSVGKGAGIFFLILILIIILALAVILYILWKKGKRYSFDLTVSEHETPLQTLETTGVFEQTKGSTTNLDYIQEDKSNPVANGCPGETPELSPSSDQQNVPEEDSFSSDLSLGSPMKKVEFNLDLELIGGESDLVTQATDSETTDNDNENNNNETNTANDVADLFTEINLDDAQ